MHDFKSWLFAAALAAAMSHTAIAAPTIVDPLQGIFTFTGGSELSGISYAGGNSFYVVSDTTPTLFPLNVTVNTSTAFVTSAVLGTGVTLNDAGGTPLPNPASPKFDAEGVAYDPVAGKVWVSNESEPGLRRHDPVSGNQEVLITTASHAQLNVFSNRRVDFGWEALTRAGDGSVTWVANEESLTTDGPQPTSTTGTAVRFQRFNSSMTPTGQWAYITDPDRGPITFPSFPTQTFSGVSDFTLLPDGSLLVLERAFGGSDGTTPAPGLPQFRSRLYWVSASSFTGGADISGISNLDTAPLGDLSGEPWQPALTKTLLWEKVFPAAGFDGLTLGQTLDDGSIEILLISDNQGGVGGGVQGLYPLRLVVPEPSALALAGIGAALVAIVVRRRRVGPRPTSP